MTKPFALREADQSLIKLLRQNSRRPVSEIAALLGVSRQTVQNRMSRLIDKGIIKRFTIETTETEEQDRIQVMYTLKVRQASCSKVYATIKRWPELLRCWSITGDRDMVLVAEAVAAEDAEEFRAKLARHPDIEEIQTSHILKEWKR